MHCHFSPGNQRYLPITCAWFRLKILWLNIYHIQEKTNQEKVWIQKRATFLICRSHENRYAQVRKCQMFPYNIKWQCAKVFADFHLLNSLSYIMIFPGKSAEGHKLHKFVHQVVNVPEELFFRYLSWLKSWMLTSVST